MTSAKLELKEIPISHQLPEGHQLKILTYPHPLLSKVAQPVEIFDQNLKNLCQNMLRTMYQSPGIGLAAPQVGESLRIFVVDVEYEREKITSAKGEESYHYSQMRPLIFINPVIREREGSAIYQEGCLSLPGILEEVCRSQKITVDFFDLEGRPQTLEANELLAICIQHENDHLDGIVLLDRLGQLKKNLLKKKLLKQKRSKN
jgi:peptide deformylase